MLGIQLGRMLLVPILSVAMGVAAGSKSIVHFFTVLYTGSVVPESPDFERRFHKALTLTSTPTLTYQQTSSTGFTSAGSCQSLTTVLLLLPKSIVTLQPLSFRIRDSATLILRVHRDSTTLILRVHRDSTTLILRVHRDSTTLILTDKAQQRDFPFLFVS